MFLSIYFIHFFLQHKCAHIFRKTNKKKIIRDSYFRILFQNSKLTLFFFLQKCKNKFSYEYKLLAFDFWLKFFCRQNSKKKKRKIKTIHAKNPKQQRKWKSFLKIHIPHNFLDETSNCVCLLFVLLSYLSPIQPTCFELQILNIRSIFAYYTNL